MKLMVTFIIALSIACVLAYQVHLEPGFALLSYGQTSIETSLAVLLFIIFICFIAFYFTLSALLRLKNIPRSLSGWNSDRRQQRAQQETINGLLESAEGNWQRSEKLLTKHANDSATPLLNYLSAAQAAQSQGAYERRDEYLFKAGETVPEQSHAIHLTRAKLQLSAGQLEQTIASLRQLFNITPDNPIVLSLLLKTYFQLQDWPSLYKLLPFVRKNRHLEPSLWQDIERQTICQLLQTHSQKQSGDIEKIWSELNKQQKTQADYLAIYAEYKVTAGEGLQLLKTLEKALTEKIDASLLGYYCQLNIEPLLKIKQMEKWLKVHSSDVPLLNSLSSLLLQQSIYGKAQELLDKSLSIQPTANAYLLLGKLAEAQQQSAEKSAELYRLGLELNSPVKTNIQAMQLSA